MKYGRWSEQKKNELYIMLHTVEDLAAWLKDNGYKWGSDGLNFSIQTDTFARPEDVLARGFGNCGDFMRLFEDFIKYKNSQGVYVADSYLQYELTDANENWHYVMIIKRSGEFMLQSNGSITVIGADVPLLRLFPQYPYATVVESWRSK